MSLTSFQFFYLTTVAFAICIFTGRFPVWRNTALLFLSWWFCQQWGVSALRILLIATFGNYCLIFILEKCSNAAKKRCLTLIVIANLWFLAFFKYIFPMHGRLLPIGLSFYTFQAIGYAFDVFYGKAKFERNIIHFALYLAFFPKLVSGPLERSSNFISQLKSPSSITQERIYTGLYLILWGCFKKLVVADNLSRTIKSVFDAYRGFSGLDLLLTMIALSLQIYCDFSGYTDLVRGVAKLIGFELTQNFRLPFFARNPIEFWKRWHISLTRWFNDYVYMPISMKIFRTQPRLIPFLTLGMFLLIGLWHDATLTFVVFGLYNGLLILVYRRLTEKYSFFAADNPHSMALIGSTVLSFFLISIGIIFFRAETLEQAVYIVGHLSFQKSFHTWAIFYDLFFYGLPLFLMEWAQARKDNLFFPLELQLLPRVCLLSFLLFAVIVFGRYSSQPFVYFAF